MTQNNLFSCLSWQGIVTKQWNQLFETAEVLVAYKAEWCYHSKRKDLQNKDWQKEKAWTAGLGKRLATSQTSYHHAAERGESGLFERRTYIKEPLKRNTHKSHVERGRAMLPVFLFPPDLHTFTSRWGKEQLCWNICHCDTVTLLLQNVNFSRSLYPKGKQDKVHSQLIWSMKNQDFKQKEKNYTLRMFLETQSNIWTV